MCLIHIQAVLVTVQINENKATHWTVGDQNKDKDEHEDVRKTHHIIT